MFVCVCACVFVYIRLQKYVIEGSLFFYTHTHTLLEGSRCRICPVSVRYVMIDICIYRLQGRAGVSARGASRLRAPRVCCKRHPRCPPEQSPLHLKRSFGSRPHLGLARGDGAIRRGWRPQGWECTVWRDRERGIPCGVILLVSSCLPWCRATANSLYTNLCFFTGEYTNKNWRPRTDTEGTG